MVQLPSQVISVRGDTTAKLRNEQPAYSRVSVMREVVFACQRCGQDVRELRYPGPLPKYCPTCRAIIEQMRHEERVRRQRDRRKKAAVQRKGRGTSVQEGTPVERKQNSSARQTEADDQEFSFRHLLPETVQLLNRIGRTNGEELAHAVAGAIAAELESQRLMLTQERTALVIAVMECGEQIGYAELPDVGLRQGLEAYSAFCSDADLEDLRQAGEHARRVIDAPGRRRRLLQLSEQQ